MPYSRLPKSCAPAATAIALLAACGGDAASVVTPVTPSARLLSPAELLFDQASELRIARQTRCAEVPAAGCL